MTEINGKILSELMTEYRAKHNFTQGDLAELCKLSKTTICLVENGSITPSRTTRAKILNIIWSKKK